MMNTRRTKHLSYTGLVLVIALLVSGCLFGKAPGPLGELTISATSDSVVANDQLAIMAVGKSTSGDSMAVEPEWVIVSGTGSITPQGSPAVFTASGWEYEEGDQVVIRAFIGDIVSEPLTLRIVPILKDSLKVNLFPKPEDPWVSLPQQTEYYIEPARGKLDDLWDHRLYSKGLWEVSRFSGTHRFIKHGQLVDPGPIPIEVIDDLFTWENQFKPFYDYPEGPLPDHVYLSHRVHYELASGGSGTLYDNASYSQSVSYTKGTTETEAKYFAWSTSAELTTTAKWGWGKATAKVKTTIEEKTTRTVSVTESTTVEETKSVDGKDGYITRYGIYNRVDSFYFSDVNGVPVDVSPIFAGYYLHPVEVSLRGTEIAIVTHHFERDE